MDLPEEPRVLRGRKTRSPATVTSGGRPRGKHETTAPVHAPAEPISSRGAARWAPASRAQVVLFWGPEFIAIYNDAYAPVFGAKLPSFSRRRSRP
jgi:hypothetical protein